MSINNYDFDKFTINLYVDENNDWLCHFVEMPNISAFGDTPEEALMELQTTWEMVKEDFIVKGLEIPIALRKLAHN